MVRLAAHCLRTLSELGVTYNQSASLSPPAPQKDTAGLPLFAATTNNDNGEGPAVAGYAASGRPSSR
jgi:hypothetical protein